MIFLLILSEPTAGLLMVFLAGKDMLIVRVKQRRRRVKEEERRRYRWDAADCSLLAERRNVVTRDNVSLITRDNVSLNPATATPLLGV